MAAWRHKFYFLVVKNNILLTRRALSFCFYHSKIKFISSRRRVISILYMLEVAWIIT